MIWAPRWRKAGHEDLGTVTEITAQIAQVCGDTYPMNETQIRELARAVAVFVEREYGAAVADPRSLMLLASRALASIGEKQVARRLLVFGTGLVKPAEWEISGEESMWVLDLRQMTVLSGCELEIVFFRCLDLVIDSIAEVWDGTGGGGVLGLCHVTQSAASLLADKSPKRDISGLVSEMKSACRQKLGQIKSKRGWTDIPFVMDLDW